MRTFLTLGLQTLMALFMVSCCCFEPVPVDPQSTPIVREATIAEFNSQFNGTSPAPSFNIATFKFPASTASSGDLPNDGRFLSGPWSFTQTNYPLRGLTTNYTFRSPSNSLLAGDIIVDTIMITPTDTVAMIRVRGSLHRLPPNPALRTDDAQVVVREIQQFYKTATPDAGKSICATLDARAVEYGTDTSSSQTDYTIDVVENGQPTSYSYPANWPTDSKGNMLPPIKQPLTSDIGFYTLAMRLGDWFYYRAVNGMSFIVVVTNIQRGTMPPFIQRMTIKFAESYGCENCKP
ncbi:MAG: hypothetical protein FGM32_07475 [Candidatus Kapabacteria bacterium]|nr:hypothetical protein [Candidatus Kapabacteria bacterium]